MQITAQLRARPIFRSAAPGRAGRSIPTRRRLQMHAFSFEGRLRQRKPPFRASVRGIVAMPLLDPSPELR